MKKVGKKGDEGAQLGVGNGRGGKWIRKGGKKDSEMAWPRVWRSGRRVEAGDAAVQYSSLGVPLCRPFGGGTRNATERDGERG